jgi:hypothetical protein
VRNTRTVAIASVAKLDIAVAREVNAFGAL